MSNPQFVHDTDIGYRKGHHKRIANEQLVATPYTNNTQDGTSMFTARKWGKSLSNIFACAKLTWKERAGMQRC
eukprot:4286841-Amphidinium_carterae.1